VELTILGSQGTWPGPGGEACGYLLTHDGFHLWLDAGTGTFARLQQHIGVDEIGAVLITHGHADHFLDMVPTFYARHYGELGGPGLPFYTPSDFPDRVAPLVSENGRDVMRIAFAFNIVEEGKDFEIGPFRVEPIEVVHIGVRSYGYRIAAGGHVLAYTGDTGPCEAAERLAKDAEMFLCEATYQNHSTLAPFHLSAAQAGEHAAAGGAGRLVLTHIPPILDPHVSLAEAAATFSGAIEVATSGMMAEVRG
jgi:ribonuclease BN (tRNA processing enzyme)